MSQLCLKTTSAHPLYRTSALVVVGWAVSSSCSFSRATYYLCTAYRRITSRIYRLNDLIGRTTHSDKKNNRKEPCARKSPHSDNISDTTNLPSWQSKDCRSGGCLYIRNLSIDYLLIFQVGKLGSDLVQA